MLLCDGCDKGFHLFCTTPRLHAIPQGDWYSLLQAVAARMQHATCRVGCRVGYRAVWDTVPCGIPCRVGYRAVWGTMPCWMSYRVGYVLALLCLEQRWRRFCLSCRNSSNEFDGFEDGEEYALEQFGRKVSTRVLILYPVITSDARHMRPQ